MPDRKPPGAHSAEVAAAIAAGVNSGLAPIDEELWERRMKALTLRNAGGTFEQIAKQLGISATVARADVRLALREVLSETTEEMIARQRSVLFDMQRGAYPAALRGDRDAIVSIVKCLEQEAKLLGLYAPTRQVVGISDVDFAEQAAALIGKLGLTPPRELVAGGDRAVADADAIDAMSAEIIEGLIERISGVPFDLPAEDLEVEPESVELAAARVMDDEAISRAAAEAIVEGETADDVAPWSNL
jgi:hypothetical protein